MIGELFNKISNEMYGCNYAEVTNYKRLYKLHIKIIDELVKEDNQQKIMLIEDELETETCQEFNISSPDMLRNKTRRREIVLTRQVIMYYDLVYNKVSLQKAADRFNLDHATAHHAKNTVSNLLETDKGFKKQVESIINRLKSI